MPDTPVVLAVDQGTSSTKAVAIDADGRILRSHSVALGQATPRPGWVEQDPVEILDSVITCLNALVAAGPETPVSVGLSSQRESALAWDAATGKPLSPLLGWQDRRTAAAARALTDHRVDALVRERSGLPLDPMFSALKFSWILDDIDPDRLRSTAGDIRLGTVDCWLLDRLTGQWRIEAGNASRTQLMNLSGLDWDADLLDLFRIPFPALPPIVRSDAPSSPISSLAAGGISVGFGGVLGDSHAALFGHGVRIPGRVKVTFGTGSSVMGLTDNDVPAMSGMAHTLGWLTDAPARAFEGNILSTGATLLWLGRLLGREPAELAAAAQSAATNAGVCLVPAFAGLGAPYWDEDARAVLCGFDQGTTIAHLARAAFESIPHQIEDVLERADVAAGARIEEVLADGGPARNDWLMQLQADLSGRRVGRPDNSLLSVTGAGHLAGLTTGLWGVERPLPGPGETTVFTPSLTGDERARRRGEWAAAVARARGGGEHTNRLAKGGAAR